MLDGHSIKIAHIVFPDDPARIVRQTERAVPARAVAWHVEDRQQQDNRLLAMLRGTEYVLASAVRAGPHRMVADLHSGVGLALRGDNGLGNHKLIEGITKFNHLEPQ